MAAQDTQLHIPTPPTIDPYFLHPADNPGSVIATPILDGRSNYLLWSCNMLRALICKDKLGFVDGFLPKPAMDDPFFKAWVKCDYMVTSWI
jgi:hypothetical protein